MKLLDWASRFSRRVFMVRGAATFAVAAVAGKTLLANPAAARAVEPTGLSAEQSRTLLKFTRDLFPHDRLPDSAYEKAITPLLAEAASNPSTKALLEDGIDLLYASCLKISGKGYMEVADEEIRAVAIKSIEGSAFFAKVYADTITPLYNQPDMWAKFGYQGPSSALGGYLHRGFNDLDWL